MLVIRLLAFSLSLPPFLSHRHTFLHYFPVFIYKGDKHTEVYIESLFTMISLEVNKWESLNHKQLVLEYYTTSSIHAFLHSLQFKAQNKGRAQSSNPSLKCCIKCWRLLSKTKM
ncbi:hypothetical protein XENTR_v10020960 [Xenopus tropicalis]|nr:hypothetical protein XENTR_v10020960 [Xenopus tropicalis]